MTQETPAEEAGLDHMSPIYNYSMYLLSALSDVQHFSSK